LPAFAKHPQHSWTRGDDITNMYVYRFGLWRLDVSESRIRYLLGITDGSWDRRKANFAHLDGKGGLSHVVEQSIEVWNEFKPKTKLEHLQTVREYLEEAGRR
jgi:hypothetical protein